MRLRWRFRSPYVLHISVSRVTRERARGARRLPPGYPGSRQRKSPLRGLAPAFRKRFVDFQPDSGVAVSHL